VVAGIEAGNENGSEVEIPMGQIYFRIALESFVQSVEAIEEVAGQVVPVVEDMDSPNKVLARFSSKLELLLPEDRETLQGPMAAFREATEQLGAQVEAAKSAGADRQLAIPPVDPFMILAEHISEVETTSPGILGLFLELTKYLKRHPRAPLIRQSLLMSVVTEFESLMASVSKAYFFTIPASIDGVEFSLSDLQKLPSIRDAIELAVERRVDDLMWKSLDEWASWYHKSFGLELPKHARDWQVIREIVQRRHIVVHNQGRVSSQYNENVDEQYRRPVGTHLDVDVAYLLNAIDELLVLGLRLTTLAWDKLFPDDESLIHLSLATYELMKMGKWVPVLHLSESLHVWHKNEDQKLVSQINGWLARKRLGDFESVADEVRSWNVSAFSLRYRLARLALLDDAPGCLELIPKLLSTEQPDFANNLYDWPLLEELRQDPSFLSLMANLNAGPDLSLLPLVRPVSSTGQSLGVSSPIHRAAPVVQASLTTTKATAKKATAKKATAKKATVKKATAQ
jgi:hypothetical protein